MNALPLILAVVISLSATLAAASTDTEDAVDSTSQPVTDSLSTRESESRTRYLEGIRSLCPSIELWGMPGEYGISGVQLRDVAKNVHGIGFRLAFEAYGKDGEWLCGSPLRMYYLWKDVDSGYGDAALLYDSTRVTRVSRAGVVQDFGGALIPGMQYGKVSVQFYVTWGVEAIHISTQPKTKLKTTKIQVQVAISSSLRVDMGQMMVEGNVGYGLASRLRLALHVHWVVDRMWFTR